jgi:hypothetical protein
MTKEVSHNKFPQCTYKDSRKIPNNRKKKAVKVACASQVLGQIWEDLQTSTWSK